jgi:hypothetical protein
VSIDRALTGSGRLVAERAYNYALSWAIEHATLPVVDA